MKHYNLLIIGGDAAGMSAASQARRQNRDITIGVFEKGIHVSYAACGMPYYIAGRVKDYSMLMALDPDKFSAEKNIDILMKHEVTAVDFDGKKVAVSSPDGTDDCSYDKLVIATGARAFEPPIPGIEQEGIFTLRKLGDGIAIKQFITEKKPKKAVIVGGGFIGLELAEAFRELDIETSIVEKMPAPAMSMSPPIRELIVNTLKEHGVNIYTEKNIVSFEKDSDSLSVVLDDDRLPADIIIVSVGVRPGTGFLKDTKLDIDERGVIQINEKSETNIKDVYAAGDCAGVMHLVTGKRSYIPLGSTANKQGRVAGLQAAGVTDEAFKGVVGSQFVKVFDLEAGKTGFNEHDAEVNGIPSKTIVQSWKSRAGYCPASEKITVTLTVNSETDEIIGGEVAGHDGAALRVNAIAVAVSGKMKVDDFAYLDMGYAPPFSPVWDSLLAAAQTLKRK